MKVRTITSNIKPMTQIKLNNNIGIL